MLRGPLPKMTLSQLARLRRLGPQMLGQYMTETLPTLRRKWANQELELARDRTMH